METNRPTEEVNHTSDENAITAELALARAKIIAHAGVRIFRRAIRMHDLTYVGQRLADCLLAVTLEAENSRPAALFVTEEPFINMTGLAKQHVNAGLERIEAWNVFKRVDGWYRLLVPSRWTAPLHTYFQNSPDRVKGALQMELRLACPTMREMDFEPAPDLDEKLLELLLEGRVTESVTPVTNLVTYAVTESVTPVTESVTSGSRLSESLSMSVSRPQSLEEALAEGRAIGLQEDIVKPWFKALQQNGWKLNDGKRVRNWKRLLHTKLQFVNADATTKRIEKSNRTDRNAGIPADLADLGRQIAEAANRSGQLRTSV